MRRKACRYITDQLRAYGYEPAVHEFQSHMSYPRATLLAVKSADSYEIPA